MVKSNKNPNELVKELGMIQMNDERELLIIIKEIIPIFVNQKCSFGQIVHTCTSAVVDMYF